MGPENLGKGRRSDTSIICRGHCGSPASVSGWYFGAQMGIWEMMLINQETELSSCMTKPSFCFSPSLFSRELL